MNFTRIFEACIIAVIAAMLSAYTTQQVLLERMSSMQASIEDVKSTQQKIISDLYVPAVKNDGP